MRRVERCPACDGAQTRVAVRADASAMARYLAYSARKYGGLLDDWVNAEPLTILRCEVCGHHWYRDQPTAAQLSAMYAAGRRLRGVASPSREPTNTMLDEMHRLYQLVGGGTPSLLDYGSGFGRWARAAVLAGFRVYAYEPSAERGGEIKAPFTLVHDLDALQGMAFDVIQMEQVLEHVPDPVMVLRGVREFCHARSLLRVTVPNIQRSDEGRNVWREWPFNGDRAHVMAPFEHLHGFTQKSLMQVLKRANFELMESSGLMRYYPLLLLRLNIGRWISVASVTQAIARQC